MFAALQFIFLLVQFFLYIPKFLKELKSPGNWGFRLIACGYTLTAVTIIAGLITQGDAEEPPPIGIAGIGLLFLTFGIHSLRQINRTKKRVPRYFFVGLAIVQFFMGVIGLIVAYIMQYQPALSAEMFV